MPGMSLDQPEPCPECNGSGVSRYANGMGGQSQECFNCHGSGEVLNCRKCGAGPDEECDCVVDNVDEFHEGTMARAVISTVDPQEMLDMRSAGQLPDGVDVDMGKDPRTTVVTGERDAVFDFLTQDLGIDPVEADEYIDREEPSTSEGCPECNAPAGMPCDVGCSNSAEGTGPDPDRFREAAGFDKFMDRIIVEERRYQKVDRPENNPQRILASRYQERPMGRTRMGVAK